MSAWRRCRPCPRPCEGLGQQPGPLLQKLLGWQGASWLPSAAHTHSISWSSEARIFPRQLQQHLLHQCYFLLSFLAASFKNEV